MIKLFKKTLSNTVYTPKDGMIYWRERIFLSITLVVIVIGLAPVSFGIVMAFIQYHPLLAIADAFAYFIILFIFFNRSIKLKARINILIYIFLSLSLLLLLFIGYKSPWMVYLVGYNLLTALLLGLKSTYNSLIKTTLIILIIAFGIKLELFPDFSMYLYTTSEFITISINVLVISSISSIPLAILLNGLRETIDGQSRLQKLLRKNISELIVAKNKAEEADNLKSSFLANISHEIRTPLNTINGYSSILIGKKNYQEEDQKEMIQYIYESGEYLQHLMNNILDISMIDAKELKFLIKEFSLSEFFEDLKIGFDPRINKHKEIELIFSSECISNEIMLYTDDKRLKQVFINLINNAYKFTNQGSIIIGFTILLNQIHFYVKDTGLGIDSKYFKSIFDRFRKLDGKYFDHTEGSGLGLPISKGIIEKLGGKIWVESVPEQGSTFYFTIPFNKLMR